MKNVVVIGAGTMGNGIAHAAAAAGLDVTLVDVSDELLQKAMSTIAANLQRGVDKGKMTAGDKVAVVGRIKTATDLGAIAFADIVIEAVVENLGAKTDLFAKLDAIAQPECILASNTSAIFVIDIDDVFEARMHSGCAMASSLAKRSVFAPRFSTTASMTMSAKAMAPRSVAVLMRPTTATLSPAVIFPLSTPRCRLAAMVDMAFCSSSSLTSTRVTSSPAAAAAWAIPLPMVPAPITTTFFMHETYHVAGHGQRR